MNAERWRRISEVYHAVRNLESRERADAIADRCAGDDVLQREVESLMHHGLPSTPAFDAVAHDVATRPDELLGAVVGTCVVESLVGEGGMGRVYRARDVQLGRLVAVKVLPPELAGDSGRRARLDREAQFLATLNHPNIAAIYGVVDGAGVRGLVLEFVEGDTLAQRIERANRSRDANGRMPIAEVIRIAAQLVDALDAAHEGGIIHRDLKPANVKLTPEGTVKVLDFGLAKALDDNSPGSDSNSMPTAMTQAGVILGTAMYMSPEQARGRPVGKRTDIWSFGCVLFEMLAGRPAFDGETMSDVLAAVIDRSPDWKALPSDTPKGLEQLLRRCLEKDAKRRLRDIGDAHDFLEAVDDTPQLETGADRQATLRSRERLAWAAVVAGLLGAVLLLWQPRQAPGPPEFRRVVRLTSGPDMEFGPAISPDGKWVAYLGDAGGSIQIWVKFLTGRAATALTLNSGLELPTRSSIGGLAISPDGTEIAFDAGEKPGTPANLFDSWVIPAPLGGTPRKLVERGRAVRWSPDGRRIAYVRAGATAGDSLFIADADGSNERRVIGLTGGMHVHWPAWSADGQHVYFSYSAATANDEPSEIYRVAATGGRLEPVVQTPRRALFAQPLPEGRGLLFAANPQTSDLALWWHSLTAEATMRPVVGGVGEYGELSAATSNGSAVAVLGESDRRVSLLSVERDGTGRLRSLTDGSTGDQDPTVSADAREIVFSSAREGSRNLWRIAADGTGARALTSGPAFDERPALSVDGRRLAFASDRGGRRGIWVMNADGGAARLVTPALVFESPSWSPDGRHLVYSGNGGAIQELMTVDVETGVATRLPTPGPATAPVWSPRGDVIAYVEAQPPAEGRPSSSRVALIRRDGTPVQPRVLDGPNVLNGFLAWAPDGRHLAAFVEPGAAPTSIWVLDSWGSEAPYRATTMPASTRIRGGAWMPDGKTLVVGQARRVTDIVLLQP